MSKGVRLSMSKIGYFECKFNEGVVDVDGALTCELHSNWNYICWRFSHLRERGESVDVILSLSITC